MWHERAMSRVCILGATSAIASEVAHLYAMRGARLFLVGRDREKLATLCESLRARAPGLSLTSEARDLALFSTDDDHAALVSRARDTLGGLDTVLIAHGFLGDQLLSERSFDEAEHIVRVNFLSVVALTIPIANILAEQRHGTLGVITSVAGDRGRPRNYTYGAAKGALHIYLQGVRSRLFSSGARITTLKLGPVDTPMTTSHEKNALFGEKSAVARDIVTALDEGRAEVYVPSYWGGIMPVVRHMPERLFQKVKALSGR
jgi:decaprenylphospho-beta-D-erythro-pentofuranosid-2-ulose 2-reductase